MQQRHDEEILQGFDAFTQMDVELSDRHSITGTLSFFPSSVENAGIDSLTPALATPNKESGGWNAAVASTLATDSSAVWQTLFAVRAFDVEVRSQGDGHAQLTPDGLRNNYFNEIDRHSRQVELSTARLQSWQWGTDEHLVKIGGQLITTSFDGSDRSGPIDVRGADGRLLKRITFSGPGELDGSDVIASAYVQDHWRVTPQLALDLGLRYDYSRMLRQSHVSPRTAFSLRLDASGRTFLKGGWGVFLDQVFLQADAFNQFQQRIEQDFDPDTGGGPAIAFENRVGSGDIEEPTSRVWNIGFDHQLHEALMFRLNYRENHARGRLIVDRVTNAQNSALVLSSTGRLTDGSSTPPSGGHFRVRVSSSRPSRRFVRQATRTISA